MEIIREDVFRKQLKKGLSGGYLFYGDEDYLKGFTLRSVKEEFCADPTFALFNTVEIDAMDYSPDALLDAMMPLPMMTDKKLITLTGLNLSRFRSEEIDALADTLSALKEYDYNVLILSVPAGQIDEGTPKKPSALLTKLAEHLTPVHFAPVVGARLCAWVGKHFTHHGVTASPEVCTYLINYCGSSMFTLASETEKLSYYVLSHGRQTVTREDVEKVSVAELDADTYALTNAVLDGNYEKAFRALEVMRFRRIEPVIVLSQVSKTLCELAWIKALQKEGLGAAEISAALKSQRIPEFKVRLYLSSVASKSEQKLRRAIELCMEADRMLKLSPQGYQAIERLIGTL
ncbi:MAG: DNA polymerase III subunit delta [Clostridia bacterium]|nr:DNA polymerase III subunit delta [Clostridia bacterium]